MRVHVQPISIVILGSSLRLGRPAVISPWPPSNTAIFIVDIRSSYEVSSLLEGIWEGHFFPLS